MSEFSIPEECRSCPVQGGLKRMYDDASMINSSLIKLAEELVSEPGQQFDELIEGHTEGLIRSEDVQMIEQIVRSGVADKLDDVEQSQEQIIAMSAVITALCGGVLRMRATKNDKQYTVTICTSEEFNIDDGSVEHPAYIQIK